MNHCKICGNNIPKQTHTCEEAGYGLECCKPRTMSQEHTVEEMKAQTVEMVENWFPKGMCKERSAAITLHASMWVLFEKYLTSLHHSHTEEVEQARNEVKNRAYRFVANYKEKYQGCGMADSFLALDELLEALTPNT